MGRPRIGPNLVVGKKAMFEQVAGDGTALVRFLDHPAAVLGGEHALAKGVERGLERVDP